MNDKLTMTELEQKEARLQELYNLSDKINEEVTELNQQLYSLRLKRLLETDLLSRIDWLYTYDLALRGEEAAGIGDLLKPWGYHDRFEGEEWSLSFDDGEIRLGFGEAEFMADFIKAQKLKVNFKGLQSELKQKETEYHKVKELAETLGILDGKEDNEAAGNSPRGAVRRVPAEASWVIDKS